MKNLLVTLITFLSFGIATAQKAKFGIKGGLNIANFALGGSDANPTPASITGYNVGAFVEIKLADKLALQPELFYSTQGSKFSLDVPIEGDFINAKAQFDLGYINLPVMLKYYLADEFSIDFGPQISFLTSADATVKALGRSATQNVKKNFNSNDFGLNLGASYDINKNLFLQGRYNFGLSNIGNTEPGDNSTIKNTVLSFSLGYKFK
jgi:opacity protein-like surface antigen